MHGRKVTDDRLVDLFSNIMFFSSCDAEDLLVKKNVYLELPSKEPA